MTAKLIYTPYTYLIGWTEHNLWYYGVRYAINCHPSDLWKKYYTSSERVKVLRKQIGEPDVIQVRKTFNNSITAREWESKLLKRINAVKKSEWLNGTDNKSIPSFHDLPIEKQREITAKKKLYKPSDETRQRMSKAHKQRWAEMDEWSDEAKQKESERRKHISKNAKGLKRTPEQCEAIRQRNSGRKFGDEVNKAKGRPGIKRPEHAEKLKQAYRDGRLPQLNVSRPHTSETLAKLSQPRKNRAGFENKRWWRSPSQNIEICTNKKPDWDDVEYGRIKRKKEEVK